MPEESAIWEQPGIKDAIKQGGGILLVLVLGFGVVRPMLKSLVASNMDSSTQYISGGSAPGMPGNAALPAAGGALAIPPPAYDEKVAAAKNITGHDPARVAQVVKKWVTVNE